MIFVRRIAAGPRQLSTESTGPARHGFASPLSREAKGGAAVCAAPVGPCGQVGQGEGTFANANAAGVTGAAAWHAPSSLASEAG